jgi:hypothetical protein
MSEERTRRIQDRAHAIWEREGRPHGRDAQHWSEAEREIAAEDDAQASGVTGPTTERRARKPKPVKGEAAEAPKARQGRAAKRSFQNHVVSARKQMMAQAKMVKAR